MDFVADYKLLDTMKTVVLDTDYWKNIQRNIQIGIH